MKYHDVMHEQNTQNIHNMLEYVSSMLYPFVNVILWLHSYPVSSQFVAAILNAMVWSMTEKIKRTQSSMEEKNTLHRLFLISKHVDVVSYTFLVDKGIPFLISLTINLACIYLLLNQRRMHMRFIRLVFCCVLFIMSLPNHVVCLALSCLISCLFLMKENLFLANVVQCIGYYEIVVLM